MKARYVIGAVLLAGATYFALFGGEYGMLDLVRIRRERAAEAERLDSVRVDVDGLRQYVDSLETDSTVIERIARERWGLIKPGERLYRFDEAEPDTGAGEPRDTASPGGQRKR